jgi:hypothetical protein
LARNLLKFKIGVQGVDDSKLLAENAMAKALREQGIPFEPPSI